jgi:class 3 adenylate cyclase
MKPPITRYARSDEVCIAYQVTGEGPADVIWAPGTMSHLDMDWENAPRSMFFEKFSQFCRLIRFDKRGTGLSDRPIKMATLEERTDDIRAVMDAVGIQRAHIFGVSEGGSMACMFAAMYPERTQSLMIWGAQAKWINTPDHPWGQTQDQYESMIKAIRDDWPTVDYVVGPGAGLGKDADPALVESVLRYMRAAASPSAVRAYEEMNALIDTRPILGSIKSPTLVMNRVGDPCAIADAARDMAERIPGARFVTYPGDSHRIMLDDMDVVLSDIQEFITGERPSQSAERVLATVMFIDIVGSTDRAVQLGDAVWRDLLRNYYAVVRRTLARFRGREANVAGDGFLATFDGPARAVRCALELIKEVRQLGIEIRAGVHIGECEMLGEDVGGVAVHTGARIMSEAAPSEVLASGTIKDLVAGSGLSFADRGVHALKGVPGEWRLFQAKG